MLPPTSCVVVLEQRNSEGDLCQDQMFSVHVPVVVVGTEELLDPELVGVLVIISVVLVDLFLSDTRNPREPEGVIVSVQGFEVLDPWWCTCLPNMRDIQLEATEVDSWRPLSGNLFGMWRNHRYHPSGGAPFGEELLTFFPCLEE